MVACQLCRLKAIDLSLFVVRDCHGTVIATLMTLSWHFDVIDCHESAMKASTQLHETAMNASTEGSNEAVMKVQWAMGMIHGAMALL